MISNRGSNGDFLENNPLLTRIAQALEISQAAFYGPTGSDLEQTAELLRLWQTITDGHDREKLLTVARKFAPRA